MKYPLLLFGFAIVSHLQAATVVTVNWAAAFDNGFALQNGTALPVGNEVRLGSFDVGDSQIVQMIINGDLMGLSRHFTAFGTAFIGTDAFPGSLGTIPLSQRGGLFEKSTTMELTPALASDAMYIWVFKTVGDNAVAGDFSNVLQVGIFSNASWFFPADSGLPDSRSVELTHLTDVSGNSLVSSANIVFGSFGTGTIPATNAEPFNLAPVIPEPSVTVALIASVGLVSQFAARRNRLRRSCA